MKKILKNANLFIITILSLFIFNVKANAACKVNTKDCDPRSAERYGNIYITGEDPVGWIRNTYDSQTTKTNKHFVGSGNPHVQKENHWKLSQMGVTKHGKHGSGVFSVYADQYNFPLYCFDAHKIGYQSLFAKRFLINGYENTSHVEIFDHALMAILTSGNNTIANSVSSVKNYWAKLLALRGVIATFGYLSRQTSSTYDTDIFLVYGTAYNWLTENNNALYNKLHAVDSHIAKLSDMNTYRTYGGSTHYFSGGQVSAAKSLFIKGINAAIDFAKNPTKKVSAQNVSTPSYGEKVESLSPSGDTIVSQDIVHKIKINNLTNSAATLIVNDPTYTGTVPKGITTPPTVTKIKIGDKELDHSAVGQNLIPLSGADFSKEVVVEITVHIEGRKEAFVDTSNLGAISPGEVLKCGQQPIEYELKVKYDNKEKRDYSDWVGVVWQSVESNSQRYVAIYPNGNKTDSTEQELISKGSTELIPQCDCKDLEKSCEVEAKETGNLDGPACQELKDSNCGDCSIIEIACDVLKDPEACDEKYKSCDVTCKTEVDEFDCCDYSGDTAHLIVEGENIPVNINGPEESYGCFVVGVDKQKEVSIQSKSYEQSGYSNVEGVKDDTEKNTYTLTKNKYCLISCKEDYAMSLPTARQVNAGRYFTFKAQVNGTKTCYSNTIDVKQFNVDIGDIAKEMETALNKYITYKYVYDNASNLLDEHKYKGARTPLLGCGCIPDSSKDKSGVSTNIRVPHYQFTISEPSVKSISIQYTAASNSSYTYNYTNDYIANSIEDVKNYIEKGQSGTTAITDGGYSYQCDSPCGKNSTTLGDNAHAGNPELVKASLKYYRDYWKSIFNKLQDRYNELLKEYDDCSNDSWSSHLNYDPKIYYNYEENYLTEFYNNYGTMVESREEEKTNSWYCQPGKLNGEYEKENCSSNTTNRNLQSIKSISCNLDSGNIDTMCSNPTKNLPYIEYISKSSQITANYKPEVLFYNVHPSGEILDKEKASSRDDVTPVTDKEGNGGLPVSLNTERGIYKYTINIQKLGEFYSDDCKNSNCELGRLIGGGENAVINEKDYEKIVKNNIGSYSCAYLVNIKNTEGWVCDFDQECTDDCISDCIGPYCEQEICTGVNCISDCVGIGCIYDVDAGNSFTQRTVSLSTLFPNGTTSPNWDRSKPKAQTTIDEIEGLQNSVYEQQPILSIKLTGTAARDIQKYNAENIPDGDNNSGSWNLDLETLGGYSNHTLDCYALGDYKEVACYSTFIDDVLANKYGKIVNSNSLIANSNYRTRGDVNGSKDEYFEKWTGTVSETDMVGPAWK